MSRLEVSPNSGHPARLRLEGDSNEGWHCGEAIEVCIAGVWLRGSVEYSQGGYLPGYIGWYLNHAGEDDRRDGWCPLVPGMEARRPPDVRRERW